MKESISPTCVGFIMDGNRRFAEQQGFETLLGHMAGKEKLYEVVNWVKEAGIPHAVFYAFSTENWRRTPKEVEGLMSLFMIAVRELRARTDTQPVRLKILGRKEDFAPDLQLEMNKLEEESGRGHYTTTIWVALSYGGRAEIVAAVNEAIKNNTLVTEDNFPEFMWSAGMPDPDIIIRTGGDKRLSNFLPWQSVYSELFFSDTYWPAFTKEEFTRILRDYAIRERRNGK